METIVWIHKSIKLKQRAANSFFQANHQKNIQGEVLGEMLKQIQAVMSFNMIVNMGSYLYLYSNILHKQTFC